MRFYHGTNEKAWKAIQEEGVLWGGYTYHKTGEGYRYTYLTPEIEIAMKYGPVVLEVEYEPVGAGTGIDNYGNDPQPGQICWQFSVFVPISIEKVKRVV